MNEENTIPEKETPETKKNNSSMIGILMHNWPAVIVAIAGLVIFALIMPKTSSGTGETLISPFGQQPVAQWVTLKTQQQAEIVAEFTIHTPSVLDERCEAKEYNVFGKQIIEIDFKDADGKLTAVAAKGKGQITLEKDPTAYRRIEIIDVGEAEVTTKGDADTVSLAEWYDGEYSYYLGLQNNPVSKEEMIELIGELY